MNKFFYVNLYLNVAMDNDAHMRGVTNDTDRTTLTEVAPEDKIRSICILGSGGHAKCVLETIYREDRMFVLCQGSQTKITHYLYDDDPHKQNQIIYGTSVEGPIRNLKFKSSNLFCAIGDNHARKRVVECIDHENKNFLWLTFRGENTSVASTAKIGSGTIILNNTNVGPDVKIGKHCIINNNSNVDHDCIIEDYVHIAPNATLCGNVHIGQNTFIGAGAVIIPNITIGPNLLIRAGSMVRHNILTAVDRDKYYERILSQ